MEEETDEIIAGRVQNDDADAFGILIGRYEAKLKRYARKFLNSPEDIEDLVQEVFIKAYTNIQSCNTSLRFSPWIYRIAHNAYVNELKKQQRRPFSLFDSDTIFPQLAAMETADAEALATELADEVEQSLDTLDAKYREPMVLYFYEQLSYQEIADVLQIPVTTVGVRIKRGKDKLKSLYQSKT